VLVLGMTFKENCPDLRNSKVIDVVRELKSFGVNVFIHDPIADSAECEHEYGVSLTPLNEVPRCAAIVACVAHKEYGELGVPQLAEKLEPGGVFVDVQCQFKPAEIEEISARLWRL